ncbi:MAG: DUF5057 domain-containing protein, partial [Anoxybacillus gonensis]|nr:DUF5057 domain-containing protein [Anoxybacillus gonensis]
MKRAVSVFLTLLLLVPLFTPVMTVRATDNITYNVLEIVSHADQLSSSPLKKELGSTSNINVTTMTMKRFVALRDELDGKYDAIVISSGDYNPTKLGKMSGNTQAHNTANVLNDITDLKARQIKTFYIDKGLPVFLHDSSVKKYPTSKLYSYSQSNAWKTKQNVIFFTTNTNIKNYFASNGTKRPHFVLTNAPSPTKTYKKGDTLSFVYQITNYTQFQNKWLTVNLYIDSDFNDKYTSEEIVASKQVQGATGTISYTLPAGYSGPRYWKVEIVDETSALKDYVKGFVKFQDVVANIKVLQIRKGNDASSLLNTKNMNPNFLSRTNEYNIHIDVTTLDDFQKSKTYEPNYSHEVINGKYDMIIFGFADCYNGCGSTTLNPNAVQSVKNFIQSGQSVMFTHDVMFGENNIWVNEFGSIVGQIQPWTDLGNGAPNPSTSTKQVNSGLMTNYPFQLGENISIALTHNQYYTLNLEDENIISWYNIVGSSRDVYDSWNHYYTYSNGNVTYSGTGHVGTTSAFPEEEQKLFVNTMYRAFFGSNHAPQLTVVTPQENEKIPSNQPIELSYKVEDLDLVDRTFSTKVWLNGQEVYAENNVPNG